MKVQLENFLFCKTRGAIYYALKTRLEFWLVNLATSEEENVNSYIRQAFESRCNIKPDSKMALQLVQFCHYYETRGDNPHALNTDLFGVTPIFFVDSDRQSVFDILGIDQAEMKRVIAEIPTINNEHKVTSDVYNLATIWAVHKFLTTPGISSQNSHNACVALLKLLHYKFFTSLMSHIFPHKSNLGIMQQTIASLSNQFDIKQYGTWKKVFEARAEDVLDKGNHHGERDESIHYPTLLKFDNDQKILYVLSDIQTRLRNKIILIVNVYYQVKEKGDYLGSYSNVAEIDGEKVIASNTQTYDVIVSNLSNRVQNVHTFINRQLVNLIVAMFTNIRQDMFVSTLTRFSEMASLQAKENKLDLEKVIKGEKHYIGARVLISTLIQKTYRRCKLERVNMKSATEILKKTMDLYRSSRVNDEDILAVKRSVLHFIEGLGKYTREATVASLAIGFILYIMLQSFEFLT